MASKIYALRCRAKGLAERVQVFWLSSLMEFPPPREMSFFSKKKARLKKVITYFEFFFHLYLFHKYELFQLKKVCLIFFAILFGDKDFLASLSKSSSITVIAI